MPNFLGAALDAFQRGKVLNSSDGLSSVPSGYGAEYDQLFANNPYRNLTYKKSGWQNFLSALGFRTDAERWQEDAQVNANEYDAGIFSMMQQNEFNSPQAQAERMRQAGLNPDLLGIGDVQEAASPTEDPNGMSQNVGDEFADFGNTIVSVFSRAMAVFKDFKSIQQMNTIIDGQNIDNAVKMTGAIDSFIESSLSAEDMVDFETYQQRMHDLSSQDLLVQNAEQLGFSRRQRPQYYRLMHDRLLSMSTDKKAYELFKGRIDAMAGAKESEVNPFSFGVRGTYEPTGESAVDIMVKGLSRAHKKAIELTAQRDASLAAVQNQEAQTLEDMSAGVASARSQVTEYNSKKAVSQWNQFCADVKKDMLRQLQLSASSGDWLAKAMLFSWSLDDIARMNVNMSAGANLGLNFGLGATFLSR